MAQTEKQAGVLSPRFEDRGELLLAGLGGRYGNANRAEIPPLWGRFGAQYLGRVPGQSGKKCYGACVNADAEGNLDYYAAVEVARFEHVWAELTRLRLAPQRYAIFAHEKHISAIGETWMAIYRNWAPASGRQILPAPSFEVYAEAFGPDNLVGNVEIWIPIKA